MKIITNALIESFQRYLISEEKSSATLEKYSRDIKVFSTWIGGRELDKELVLHYKQYLTKKYSPASVNSMLSSINSFFTYTEWFDLKVKTLKMQRRLFCPSERELTKEEYKRLLEVARRKGNKRLYYIMQTICATGIRISELKFINTEAVRCGRATINCKGKWRVVIIPKALCDLLKGYSKEQHITNGCLFITKNSRPVDRSNIWVDMKKLCESAGVPESKVFPHNLRHLFARTYYSLQKDIVRLADILGHSSVNTTRIYTVESGEVHRQQIQRLGLVSVKV